MPTLFIHDGFRFFFYSNDHRPIHVHVRKGSGEAVFNVEEGVAVRESVGFQTHELRLAEKITRDNRQLILEKWHEHLS